MTAGQPDGETARAAGERERVLRLDDEVNVVALDGEMEDAELGPAGRADAPGDGLEQARGAQRGQPRARPQGQVHRVRSAVRSPGPMRHRPPAARDRRPAGALPAPAPADRPSQ